MTTDSIFTESTRVVNDFLQEALTCEVLRATAVTKSHLISRPHSLARFKTRHGKDLTGEAGVWQIAREYAVLNCPMSGKRDLSAQRIRMTEIRHDYGKIFNSFVPPLPMVNRRSPAKIMLGLAIRQSRNTTRQRGKFPNPSACARMENPAG